MFLPLRRKGSAACSVRDRPTALLDLPELGNARTLVLTFAPLTATPYRDGRRIRRSSLRTNVLLRALTVFPVAQLGARSVMLRIPLPEYADGTLTLHLLISVAQIRHPREAECEA